MSWRDVSAALLLVAVLFTLSDAAQQRAQVRHEQQRIACMLAHDDETEEAACLPPSYGSDW